MMVERRKMVRRKPRPRGVSVFGVLVRRPTKLQVTTITASVLTIVDGWHSLKVWLIAIGMVAAVFSTSVPDGT